MKQITWQNKKILVSTILLSSLAVFLLSAGITFSAEVRDTPEEQVKDTQELPHSVRVVPQKSFNKAQVKALLEEKEFISSTLTSVIPMGDSEITDFVTKGPEESLDEVDKEFREQRGTLLLNLLETSDLSQDQKKDMQKQYSRDSIEQALKGNTERDLEIREIQVILPDKAKAEGFETSVRGKENVKEVVLEEVELSEETESKEVLEESPKEDSEPIQEKQSEPEGTSATRSILDTVQASVLSLVQPIKTALASAPAWVPDYVSIAFFDTDEVGTYPFEWWGDADNATTYERADATSHWWRTYLIHRGTNDYPYFGKYTDEGGQNFGGWSQMNYPYATSDSYHSLASHDDRLYHAVKGSSGEMFIRDSWDGGDTWNEFRSIGRHTNTGFDLVSHDGKLCIAHKGSGNNHIYVGCATDGWWDWSSATWYDAGSFRTTKQPALASTFGSLWLGHTGTNSVVYLASSYNSGQTWNPGFTINNRTSNSGVSMVGIGDPNWQNEKLCVLRRGTDNEMYQSCLYRYGANYDQWNWHPWQRQQGQTNDTPVLVSDSTRIGQVHRTMVNKVESRTVQWINPGGRGYISHMRWDGDPGFGSNNGYEHDVQMYNRDANDVLQDSYLTKSNEEGYPECKPETRYVASNLPNTYLDTRYDGTQCDSSNNSKWITYAIGTADAHLISSDKYYFTYYHTYKGANYRPVFSLGADWTEEQLWKCGFGIFFGDKWCYFTVNHVPSHTIVGIHDTLNVWDRGDNYPYWYYEKNN